MKIIGVLEMGRRALTIIGVLLLPTINTTTIIYGL